MSRYLGRRPFRLSSRMSNLRVLVIQLAAALIGVAAVCVWRIRIG